VVTLRRLTIPGGFTDDHPVYLDPAAVEFATRYDGALVEATILHMRSGNSIIVKGEPWEILRELGLRP
jgi:hypothetical protein